MTTLMRPLGGLLGGGIVETILGADAGVVLPSWTPLSLVTLQVWPRGDNASSTPVASMLDKAGRYTWAQANVSQQPAWSATGAAGGQADLVFAAASDKFLATTGAVAHNIGTGDFTIGAVFRLASIGATAKAILSIGTAVPVAYIDTTSKFAYGSSGSGGDFTTPAALNTWYSALWIRRSGVVELWVNGVKDAMTFADIHSIANNVVQMGHSSSVANSAPFDGDLPEALLASQALTTADIANWFSYTHARYGF